MARTAHPQCLRMCWEECASGSEFLEEDSDRASFIPVRKRWIPRLKLFWQRLSLRLSRTDSDLVLCAELLATKLRLAPLFVSSAGNTFVVHNTGASRISGKCYFYTKLQELHASSPFHGYEARSPTGAWSLISSTLEISQAQKAGWDPNKSVKIWCLLELQRNDV